MIPDWLVWLASWEPLLHVLTSITMLLPAAGALVLVLLSVSGVRPPERWVAIVSAVSVSVAAISALLLAGLTMLRPGQLFHEVLWTFFRVDDSLFGSNFFFLYE